VMMVSPLVPLPSVATSKSARELVDSFPAGSGTCLGIRPHRSRQLQGEAFSGSIFDHRLFAMTYDLSKYCRARCPTRRSARAAEPVVSEQRHRWSWEKCLRVDFRGQDRRSGRSYLGTCGPSVSLRARSAWFGRPEASPGAFPSGAPDIALRRSSAAE
jgi:hypothetical protein